LSKPITGRHNEKPFSGRAPPRPAGTAYNVPPDPLAGFEGRGWGEGEKGAMDGKVRKGKERKRKSSNKTEERRGGVGVGRQGDGLAPRCQILAPPLTYLLFECLCLRLLAT